MLELLVLIGFLISLGSVARVFLSLWGVVLLVGVLGIGILLPLFLGRSGGHHAPRELIRSASLVLLGGLLLRIVVLLSSNQITCSGQGWWVHESGACASPEAHRTRGGGPGADIRNWGQPVELHAGAQPYHDTPCVTEVECQGPLPVFGPTPPPD